MGITIGKKSQVDDDEKYRMFEELFQVYHAPLCDYCQGLVDDKAVAEDIVQDQFMYVWDNRDAMHISIATKAYLYSAVRHKAINYLKREVMLRDHAPRLVEFITYLLEEEYSEEEIARLEKAKAFLKELPEQCRAVFLMNRVEGKKYQEIANEMRVSINTVKTHLLKANRLLRERLNETESSALLFILYRCNLTVK